MATEKKGNPHWGDMPDPVMRNCIVCGKEFETVRANHKTCSPACKLLRGNQMKHQRYISLSKHYTSKSMCRLCGEPVQNELTACGTRSRRRMHEKCVLKDVNETLAAGKQLSDKQFQRLYSFGYDRSEMEILQFRTMTICKLCGEPVVREGERPGKHMHDSCVYDYIADRMKKGIKLTNNDYSRARHAGVNILEVRRKVASGEI